MFGRWQVPFTILKIVLVNIQAVMNSAASAASRKTKSGGPRSRAAPRALPSAVKALPGVPLELGLEGGSAGSRVDRRLKTLHGRLR